MNPGYSEVKAVCSCETLVTAYQITRHNAGGKWILRSLKLECCYKERLAKFRYNTHL
jgi:hypothetical protein